MTRFNAYGSDYKRLPKVPTFSAKDLRDAGAVLRINGHAPCYIVELCPDGKEQRGRMSELGGPAEWHVIGRRVWANGDVGGEFVAIRKVDNAGLATTTAIQLGAAALEREADSKAAAEPVRLACLHVRQKTDRVGVCDRDGLHAGPCIDRFGNTLAYRTPPTDSPAGRDKPRANRPGHVRKIKDERNELRAACQLAFSYLERRQLATCGDEAKNIGNVLDALRNALTFGDRR